MAMVYRTRIDEIRRLGRATQGVMVMTKLGPKDQVISMSAFKERAFEDVPELPKLSAPRRATGTNGRAKGGASGNQSGQLAMDVPASDEAEDVEGADLDDDLEEDTQNDAIE
jgi:hypothetical protein